MAGFPKRVFTDKEKRQILALRSIGVPFRFIGKRFNISDTVIMRNVKQWQKEEQ